MKTLFTLKKILSVLLLLLAVNVVEGQTVHRPQKLFIKHGLQFHTWTFSGANEWPLRTTATSNINRSTKNYGNRSARYIRIQLPGTNEILALAEVQVMSGGVNVALGKTTAQSSTQAACVAARAVDGNTSGQWEDGSISNTQNSGTVQPWWEVDLGEVMPVKNVVVWNRLDCCGIRLRGYHILASEQPFASNSLEESLADPNVYLISSHFPIDAEYDDLPLVQDYYEKPMLNILQFQNRPNLKWGLEKAPYGDQMKLGPTQDEITNGFLSETQLSKLDNLMSMGFGDEENYSDNQVTWLTQWYNIAKNKYPNVLLHNNQYVGQWSDQNLRYYIQTARPDFISIDNYLFSEKQTDFGGGSLHPMYSYLSRYRRLALEGTDGQGNHPIEFGQYLIGFRQGSEQHVEEGGYYTSESQINGEIFGSLTMGAKWVSAWRYSRGNRSYWIDDAGNRLPGYNFYADALKEFNNISPYLSRLLTSDIRIIPGKHMKNGATVTNPKPNGVEIWDGSAGPYITGITATNLVSTTNNGLRGDVLIGYFKPVKNIDTDPDVTMAPIHHKEAVYLMIMNGLTKPSIGLVGIDHPDFLDNVAAGNCVQARQKIRIDIDFKDNRVDELKRINRTTGMEETVDLTHVSGNKYYTEIELGGGKADLFYWKNAHNIPVQINVALNKPVTQSSSNTQPDNAGRANDGNTDGDYFNNSVSHTRQGIDNWWQVDLGAEYDISNVKIFNRTDCCGERLSNYHLFISNTPITGNTVAEVQAIPGIIDLQQVEQADRPSTIEVGRRGRYVRIQLRHDVNQLAIAEVQVFEKQMPTSVQSGMQSSVKWYRVSKDVIRITGITDAESIQVNNAMGQTILKRQVSGESEYIDITPLHSGYLYILTASDKKGEKQSFKFVK